MSRFGDSLGYQFQPWLSRNIADSIMICKSYRRLGTLARPPVCPLARSGKSAQATFPRELG